MGLRGPKPREHCVAGHDLRKPENVSRVKRKKGDKIYYERQCRPCANERKRDWWRENRGKDKVA